MEPALRIWRTCAFWRLLTCTKWCEVGSVNKTLHRVLPFSLGQCALSVAHRDIHITGKKHRGHRSHCHVKVSLNTTTTFHFRFPRLIGDLCLVGGSRNISSTSSPVDVDVLSDLVLLIGKFRLDVEGVCTEVIALCLKKVRWQILGAVTVEPV